MIEKLRKMDNFAFLNQMIQNAYDERTKNLMRESIKNLVIKHDEMHEAVLKTNSANIGGNELIDLTEKLLLLSDSMNDLIAAITFFVDAYHFKLKGLSEGKPTKIAGFLKSEISSLKTQIEDEKKNRFDVSTVCWSLIGGAVCLLIIASLYFFAPVANLFSADSLYGLSVIIGAVGFIIGMFTIGPIAAFVVVAVFGFIFVHLNNLLPLGLILKILITAVLALIAFGCVCLVQEEFEKKKKEDKSSMKMTRLNIENKKEMITLYVELLIEQLNKLNRKMNSNEGVQYYEEFAREIKGVSINDFMKGDQNNLVIVSNYYHYVLEQIRLLK